MDRILSVVGCSEGFSKPEIILVYGAFAVLVTVIINWALATLLVVLKPFTCAAILLAFVRPDIAQNFLQEESIKDIAEKSKNVFLGLVDLLIRFGEQIRVKLQ